jgi:hypothetical protein
MMNTKSGILVLLTAAFALLWTGIGFTQPAQEIIAVVNDSTITRSDLMWEEAHLMQEMRLRKTPLPGEAVAPIASGAVG